MWAVCAPRPGMPLRFKGRTHLTAVETRLHVLETALRRLFPGGDMESLTQNLLLDETIDGPETYITSDNLRDSIAFMDGLSSQLSSHGMVNDESISEQPAPRFATGIECQPHSASLVTVEEQTQFVHSYFERYHVLYPLVNEETFRRDLGSQSLQPAFHLLVQSVLAIGAWLTPQVPEGFDIKLFMQAQHQFQTMPITDQVHICIVQALILLSYFAQKQGSAEESDYYIGTALRISIALNLHTNPPISLCELDKEVRRRVWWSVYCAESCSAKMYGRPLLLPDDNLITTLTASSTVFPPQTDDTTIYTGLIQQSSYHRMANKIYRQLLSTPLVTPKDVEEAEQTIDAWHRSSSFCVQVGDRSARPEWHFTARCRQILCDQNLRLLIRRPILLHWFRRSSTAGGPTYQDSAGEARCRAEGLTIARTTINTIADSLSHGRYSRLTLAFTLYAFFHALIVPLIHVKTDPWSPISISCMQDLEKARAALDHLPADSVVLSRYFGAGLRRLFEVAFQANHQKSPSKPPRGERTVGPHTLQERNNNIFGREELALLEVGNLGPSRALDFSEWMHL
ncbi:hypothetical protein P168DRAFT_304064 [Aspergillus campestris IBT 28561]|uniref:Xylanolytic transcriptional activator regulatory domain-containing protein n=1 Tax=Aspergillus campestris (strain IBT 28561) TaxID=1392248 RepID=A0A2I1D524_ASPC2|nr:uncharacterized protein P168DRAFT_304064 [Aspergillus campestris IBT 28561]PKY04958.1 hypothetical protein P168DRAFT_304064 [Aspergillus campestris IBT 28561]